MTFVKALVGGMVAVTLSTTAALAETPVLRAAVLKFGTVNWELDVIKRRGLDEANGFALDVQGVAGGSAAKVLARTYPDAAVYRFVRPWNDPVEGARDVADWPAFVNAVRTT